MLNSMVVTIEAIISTNTGMRISDFNQGRINETILLDNTSVIKVAMPSPSPLITVPVTASRGHKPNN